MRRLSGNLYTVPAIFILVLLLNCFKSNGQVPLNQKSQISILGKDTVLNIPGHLYHSPFKQTLNRVLNGPSFRQLSSKKTFRQTGNITLTATTFNSTCGNSNGMISVTASGGTPPYTFDAGDGLYYRNGFLPFKMAGTYTVTVKDAAGITSNIQVTVGNDFPPVSLTFSSYTSASGCDTKDASITLKGTGGLPPYTYALDYGNFQTGNYFNNLYPGEYTFTVKDANGCTNNFHAISVANFDNFNCNFPTGFGYSYATCTNTGDITAFGNDNNPPYLYSLDSIHYTSNNTFTGLSPGSYDVHIKDASGKRAIFAIPIYKDCSMVVFWQTTDAICHQNNGSGIISPSGGTPPYSYSMDGINYSSGNIFNNLAPGLYNFSVKDASGFSSIRTLNIQESCPTVSLSATYAGCHLSNGTITATGSGGQGPYTFSIDGINFQTNNIFSNLAKGNYTITIKDALGNTATSQAIVNENCVQVQATVTNATCNQFNGSVILTGSNGTPPYQYSIDGNYYTTLNTFGALNANTYTAYVKDVNGNTGITTFVITTTPAPQLSAVIVPASCSKNDGSIILSGTGGTAPYLFSPDKASYLPSNTFSNLNPGNYSYYLKDASGCIVGTSFDIGIDCPQITASTQHESCSRQNGSISAVASNGTLPYTYSLDGIHFQNSNQFLSLHSGNYTVTVKDSFGHWSQVNVTVNNVCPLLTVKGFDGFCKDSSARIEATTENGIPPYNYSLDGVNFKSSGMFSNLPAGTYMVTVKDSENNLVNAAVTLTNYLPPQLKVIASPCTCANSDGILQLQTHGGFLPLRFSIDSINFKTDSIFKNLPSGTYTASVMDKAGCLTTENVSIDIVDNLLLYINGSTTICEGDHTSITTNSNADSYSWIPNTSISDPHAKNPYVTPHNTTSYIVTASLGVCSKKDSVIITVLSAPIVNASNDTTLCYGQSVQLFASGAQFYNWTPSLWLNAADQSDPVVQQPQKTVTYSVTGTDNNGCSSLQPANVTVIVTPPAKIFAGNDTSIALHQPLQLKAIDVNNSRFLQYTWTPATGLSNPDIPNPIATPSADTKYYLQAVTRAGCIGLDTINVKVFNEANIWVPNAFTPNGDGLNDKLHPVLVGIKSLLYFRVFDRWGNITYQTASDHDGWDGTNKGINKPSDTYVWIAEGIDYLGNKIFRKGTVTLIR